MAYIVKRTKMMWVNEDELNEWFETGKLGLPKLSQKHTKKSNIMVHVTIESPNHEEGQKINS
jgi:hypothetical protein